MSYFLLLLLLVLRQLPTTEQRTETGNHRVRVCCLRR